MPSLSCRWINLFHPYKLDIKIVTYLDARRNANSYLLLYPPL